MSNVDERWLAIDGYPDYEVSDAGRVRRITSRTSAKAGTVLSTNGLRGGYPCVDLCLDGAKKTHLVHRLVAAAFVPAIAGKPEVNHKNAIKADNRALNLEWVTSSENQLHAYREGCQDATGEHNGQAKLTERDVLEIRRRCAAAGRPPYTVIAKQFQVTESNVRAIAARRTWAHLAEETP